MSAPRRAGGFTLIEALIALFVLAIGLLGCASLLAWSLFQGGAALRRELALGVAIDLAERVRAHGIVPDAAEFAAWQEQDTSKLPDLRSTFAVIPATGPAALERIDIAVQWSEPRAPEGASSLVLRLHRRPAAN